MKNIKVIVCLGLMALGVFVGSYTGLVEGSGFLLFGGAMLGGMLGGLLYCMINWFLSRGKSESWPEESGQYERQQVNNSVNEQAKVTGAGSVQEDFLLQLLSKRKR